MIVELAVATVLAQQRTVQGLPGASLSMAAYMPGQREVALGMLSYSDTRMQVIYQTDSPPSFPACGGTVAPGGLIEKALGWVRWSVKSDTFAGKPCMVLRCEGELTETVSKTQKITVRDIKSWWVDQEGKIVRQFEQQIRPLRTNTANCVFTKDGIDISVDDEKGRRQTSIFPNIEMQQLHDQFKPMIVDGKVVQEKKEYYVYNPFAGSFDKYEARISGWAGGKYFNMQFKGKAVEITGPRLTQTAGISEEGDLIHVQLPKERFIVMQNVPHGKEKKQGG